LDEGFGTIFNRAACILLLVPVGGANVSQEVFHFGLIGNYLFVEMLRVPVDKDSAEVEDEGGDHI
jgi:hypothetical protein